MNDSENSRPEPRETITGLRVLRPYSPTDEEIAEASALPSSACPRRYCWWWLNTRFDWQLTPAEGCVFLRIRKHPDYKNADIPCCRCDASTEVDHFEPRMPEAIQDGIDVARWLYKGQMGEETDASH